MGTKGIFRGAKLNTKIQGAKAVETLSLSNCFAGSLNPSTTLSQVFYNVAGVRT